MKAITLKVQRIRAGLTQAELAEKVGLTQPLISQLEQGFYIPGPELMQKINDVLKQQKR
jgi:transcriptional regulator with XRE-family HTH domain